MAAHEGARIKKLLTERGKGTQDLATACGVEWSAAKRYIAAAVIKPKAWSTCSVGLEKLGIDPDLVKPPRQTSEALQSQSAENLQPLVYDFSREQMERLRSILESDPGSHKRLIDYIDGYLAAHK